MNKIFYKKGSKKNYKMYIAIDWLLKILILVFIVLLIFFNNTYVIIGLISSFVLWLIWKLNIEITLIKNLSFNAYLLNKETNEFYKIGVYPNFIGALPTDDEFMNDEHFLHDAYAFKFKLSSIFKHYTGRKNFADTLGTNSILMSLSRLHNEKYVLKQLNKKNSIEKIYKISKIYSYQLEELDNYYITCDVIENNKKTEYKNVKLTINKLFDENDLIKNYIIKNCENNIK